MFCNACGILKSPSRQKCRLGLRTCWLVASGTGSFGVRWHTYKISRRHQASFRTLLSPTPVGLDASIVACRCETTPSTQNATWGEYLSGYKQFGCPLSFECHSTVYFILFTGEFGTPLSKYALTFSKHSRSARWKAASVKPPICGCTMTLS